MPLDPIRVTLSPYERLEILRQELELREQEFLEVEKRVRQILWELERQRYLQTVHPLFQQLQKPAEASELPQLNANREALDSALKTLRTTFQAVEEEVRILPASAKGSQDPSGSRPGAGANQRRAKFDSFEQFRQQKGGGS